MAIRCWERSHDVDMDMIETFRWKGEISYGWFRVPDNFGALALKAGSSPIRDRGRGFWPDEAGQDATLRLLDAPVTKAMELIEDGATK